MTTLSKVETEKATVLIPNWNGMQWLGGCLQALYSQNLQNFKTIVVDNGSSDNSVRFIKNNFPHIEVIELPSNLGFAQAVNIGIKKSTTPYIAILNTDTIVAREWLSNLVRKIESSSSDVAAINSKMLSMDNCNLIDDVGDELSWYGIATKRGHNEPASNYCDEVEIFSPSGGASLFRRDFLIKIDGFDPAFFSYLEDVDLGLRGRLLGYRYFYLPAAEVLHKSHGSGIPTAKHVKLVTRNRLLLLVKNIPFSLLFQHAPKLLYGEVYFFMIHWRQSRACLQGYYSFFISLAQTMKKRKQQMKNIKISQSEIKSLIHTRAPVPPLSAFFIDCIKGLFDKLKLFKVL